MHLRVGDSGKEGLLTDYESQGEVIREVGDVVGVRDG